MAPILGRQRSAVGNGKQRRGRTHEQTFRSFASSYPETFLASGGVGKLRIIETRSLPTLTRFYPRRFIFYVADPVSSTHEQRGIQLWFHGQYAAYDAGKQLLFDLRQNAFHLVFAEGAHSLRFDVSQ